MTLHKIGASLSLVLLLAGCTTIKTVPAGSPCATTVATVTDTFNGARRGRCAILSDNHLRFTILPEDSPPINDSPWFAFRVNPAVSGEFKVTLRYEGGRHRYVPKKSSDGLRWTPLAEDSISIEHDRSEATMTLNLDNEPFYIAAQEIITPSLYDAWRSKLEQDTGYESRELGRSLRDQPIHYFDVAKDNREVLILVGRQHPPEVSGAVAFLQFADDVLGDSALAQQFRQRFRVIAIPLLNPDGVSGGNWRHNLGGKDLNRDWGPFTQPETQLVQNLLQQLDDNGNQVRMFVDFHSTNRNLFYTQSESYITDPPGFNINWLTRSAARLPNYPFTNEANPVSDQANSKNYMYKRYGIPAVTYEVGDETDRAATREAATVFAEELMTLMLEQGAPTDVDILIRGGMVYDGSGSEPQQVDIAIDNGRIHSIGPATGLSAASIIDASNMIVVPGFIDPHTHATTTLKTEETRSNANYLTQGVTTVFIGNDGYGVSGGEETLKNFDRGGIGTNVAALAGHGAIRRAAMGMADRAATADELEAMQADLALQMENGAFGLSTGLYYAPGSYSPTSEVVELAKVAAGFGGVYDTHTRSESSQSVGLLDALDEALLIAEEAQIPVHISHIKALGADVWPLADEMLERIETAREQGSDITANQYPWRASGTRFSNALIPRWVMADSREKMHERLTDENLLPRIREEMTGNLGRRGGPDAMLVSAADSQWTGMTLADIANAMDTDPLSAAIRVVIDGDPSIASFVMNPDIIQKIAVRPWVMTGSDGSSGHPRLYGTYPKAWHDLVVSGAMSPQQFVRRSSGQVADTFGICRRGYLKPGYFADIAIIDADKFKANASYAKPTELSNGIAYLLVNGVLAIDNFEQQPALGGRVLRHGACDE